MLDTVVQDADIAGEDNSPAVARSAVRGLAILGSHPATVMQAPFGDPSWLIQACSPHNVEHRTLPRVDAWYECHDPIEDPTRSFAYLYAVSQMPLVWMRDKRALASGLFKGGRLYPENLQGTFKTETVKVPVGTFQQVRGPDGKPAFAEIMQKKQVEVPSMDGVFNATMFTSSIAYMLANAIVDCEKQGIRQIGIFGVMQASENEFTYQRPGIQYFIHEAMMRGIKVVAPRESCLFDMPQWKW